MSVKPIPDGYHSVTPYLICQGAAAAIEYYKLAFGAVELFRMPGENGIVMHAEIKIGNSPVMLADEFPDMGFVGPKTLKGTPVCLMIYVEDCDLTFSKAVAAGAIVMKPLQDQFYGDRSGTLTDPFGHVWTIATHKEDISPEELARRGGQCAEQSTQ